MGEFWLSAMLDTLKENINEVASGCILPAFKFEVVTIAKPDKYLFS